MTLHAPAEKCPCDWPHFRGHIGGVRSYPRLRDCHMALRLNEVTVTFGAWAPNCKDVA
jgi:hypothetical protein